MKNRSTCLPNILWYDVSPPMILLGGRLTKNTTLAAIFTRSDFASATPSSMPVSFAEAVVPWNVVRAELLDDCHGLTVVALVVGDAFVRILQALVADLRSPPPS